jgi:hypothetical protein
MTKVHLSNVYFGLCGIMFCRKYKNGIKREVGPKIAFRTKSEIEIMDDGYKWRKYGKKSVKNNLNLR